MNTVIDSGKWTGANSEPRDPYAVLTPDERRGELRWSASSRVFTSGVIGLPLEFSSAVIKLLKLERTPTAKPAPGGPMGGLGYRYFTISVPDIRGLIAQLEAKGIRPTVPVTEFRPGVTIAMVTDPDGNTVEFIQLG